MHGPAKMLLSALLWLLVAAGPGLANTHVFINEFMAANSTTIRDPQGQYDDWIELYNAADHLIDVAGMFLTDDLETPCKWQFPAGNSAATTIPAKGYLIVWADGDATDTGLHANFRLSADSGVIRLFDADGATLIDSIEYDEQVPDVSYGRLPDGAGDWFFMGFPSPGLANGRAYQGLVGDVTFSHGRGFYDAPFEVTLACETPGATIYYTLDGSEPYAVSSGSLSGHPYDGPILIYRTTPLRARAIKPAWMSSPTGTQTYIFIDNVVAQPSNPAGFPAMWKSYAADYQMDPRITSDPRYSSQMKDALVSIPSMSLVMRTGDLFDATQGIYANPSNEGVDWERPCSIELIYPDGQEGFQVNCGVRIQGGWFRPLSNAAKNSFRLLFKGLYGVSKLRYPLFGEDAADEFDTITLRAGANDGYTWSGNERNAQFTRDQFARDLHRDTGHAAPHGMFVHLYVNGLYWGLYNPVERPDASFSASYYGGRKEDWDVFSHKGYSVHQGDRSALDQMLATCQEASSSYEAFQRLQGKNPDGSTNSAYPNLLDVSEYIDYMIVNMWAGNWDWPWNNYWVARNRTADSTGFKFYCWDVEDIMLSSRSPLTMNKITNPDSSDVGLPHARLRQNPEYKLMFADRLHRLFFNEGILTPASLIERYTALADRIEQAIIPETARWGDMHGSRPTQDDWYAMRDRIIATYLPQRSGIVLEQFRAAGLYPNAAAPVFYVDTTPQQGGHVATGQSLTMQDTNGTIWYTLDGSDPRVPAEAASGTSGDPMLVAENASKRVLVPTGPVDDAWRGGAEFDDSAWISGAGGVGYERSTGYESYFSIDVEDQMYGRSATCYIRIPFDVLIETVVRANSLLLKVRYDDGFIAYINGKEVARSNFDGQPGWNSSADNQNSDIDAISLETFDITSHIGQLKQSGNILALQGLNESRTSSDFLISVALVAGQDQSSVQGHVSTGAIKYTGPISLMQSDCVKARAVVGSAWSALHEATFAVGPVAQGLRISELMYHPIDTGRPNDPNTEYIELTNIGDETINLNLVRFTKGVNFTFGGIDLTPGGYVVLVRDTDAFVARYGTNAIVAGQYAGSLSNGGERLELRDAVGQMIHDFHFRDNWYDLTDGLGFSLTVKDPATTDSAAYGDKSTWRPSTDAGGSPGYDDADTGIVL